MAHIIWVVLGPAWGFGDRPLSSPGFFLQIYTDKSMIVMLWSAILKKLYTAEMGILVVWLRMIRFASIKNPVQNAKPKK